MFDKLLNSVDKKNFWMWKFDEKSKKIEEIKQKYMWWNWSNFHNAQNYVFWKYSKELCENIVYVKNLYKNKKSFWIFFKDELIEEKRTDIALKVITMVTIFFITYFLHSHWILKNMKNIIFFLWFSIPLSLLPFYLTRIDSEKVIEYKLYNYFVAKWLKTRKWIIIYISSTQKKEKYLQKRDEGIIDDRWNYDYDFFDDI